MTTETPLTESAAVAQRQAEEEIVGRLGGDAAIALGVLFVALTAIGPTRTSTSWIIAATGAFALTVGFFMRFRPGRINLPAMDFLAVFSEAVLVLLSKYGGPVHPALPGVYVVIGMILFSVRTQRVALAHYVGMGASYAGVLLVAPHDDAILTRWIGLMAAVFVSGAFIRWLVGLGSRLAVSEHEARTIAEDSGALLNEQSIAKTTFIARMSHELRTPLNVVLGFSDLLAERLAGPLNDRQASYVDDICSASRHLVSLVDDVLNLTSVEAGGISLDLVTVDIAPVLDEAVRMVQAQADTAGVALHVAYPDHEVQVQADSRKVRQVVVNLLTNAIKSTPRGGVVLAQARDLDASVRVTVRDEGSGVPPADRFRIFEQYATSAPTTDGTGLGLPLSRRIIEAHGGKLILVHSAIDIGSVFAFELPHRVDLDDLAGHAPVESITDEPAYTAFAEPLSPANRKLIVRVGTWLAWTAAVVELAIAAATPLQTRDRLGIVAVAILNAISAAVVRRYENRIRLVGIDLWGAVGAIIISGGVYFSNSFVDLVPLVYGWAPMVAFALWDRRRAIGHVAFVGVCFAVTLSLRPFPQRFSIWLTIMTVISFNGAVVNFLTDRLRNLVTTEQTARHTAQQISAELAATSRHKSEFLANMSHELRTPLNAILGFADLLDAEVAGPLNERQKAYVEDIRHAAARLTTIISDVLDLAKLEAGQLTVEPQLVALGPMLEAVEHAARASADGRIEVSVRIQPGLDLITADSRRLQQVLTNLAVNAVKFTPAGGRVDVRARRAGPMIQIEVSDTGIGILPEQQARVFDPFHQGTRMIGDRLPEGTGLGLSLARSLIELHGGRIKLHSVPDQGSTFTVELPADTAPVRPPVPMNPLTTLSSASSNG